MPNSAFLTSSAAAAYYTSQPWGNVFSSYPTISVGTGAGNNFASIEAALAVVNSLGGGIIDVDPGFAELTPNQLVIPSNTWLRSWQGGGEISGPSLIAPRALITSSYSSGPAVLVSDTSRVRVTGMAF